MQLPVNTIVWIFWFTYFPFSRLDNPELCAIWFLHLFKPDAEFFVWGHQVPLICLSAPLCYLDSALNPAVTGDAHWHSSTSPLSWHSHSNILTLVSALTVSFGFWTLMFRITEGPQILCAETACPISQTHCCLLQFTYLLRLLVSGHCLTCTFFLPCIRLNRLSLDILTTLGMQRRWLIAWCRSSVSWVKGTTLWV